ncbi:regulator of G-protein signaling protein-like [Tenrec ecaudatus]|uniref:regulator of G-protein signaling protein-like n=1 Tax=Tenrec ecaudatus TaxID=94439 RepID=UPI003F5A708A
MKKISGRTKQGIRTKDPSAGRSGTFKGIQQLRYLPWMEAPTCRWNVEPRGGRRGLCDSARRVLLTDNVSAPDQSQGQEELGNMSHAEIIRSTNLIILLEDEIFADFFNTFLSLPVFGQMPFYTVENSQWRLWPEVPDDLIAKYKGLLTWLEKYRLPFFCKSNLCFQYILCQELTSFIKSPEGAKMMRWRQADQWLLQKCIGGVRGTRRFCAYLKGSAGEELADFWILAEKILSIDEMDLGLRDYYLSLLLLLKATHLQEGSKVVTLCSMNIRGLLNLSIWQPNQSTTRREILSHMQKMALFKLQSYWLPNFYIHAKVNLAKEKTCQGLMQEYETRLCGVCYSHVGGFPLDMSIEKSHHHLKRYSTRKSKRKMWQLIEAHSWSLELEASPIPSEPATARMPPGKLGPQEKAVIQMPPLHATHSKKKIINSLENNIDTKRSHTKNKAHNRLHIEGLFETKFSHRMRTITPIINHSSQATLKKAIKQSLSLGYTHWALSADAYAGSPFREYLKKQNRKAEANLLDLWQDLHHFLGVLMSNRKNGNAAFRHLLGDRICELYLNEHIGSCARLQPQTIQGLKKLLPQGDVNPWIPRALTEISKTLGSLYDEFLEEEDYWFLTFTTQNRFASLKGHKKHSTPEEETILLYKRIQESLDLSQGLANMGEMDSLQWERIATEDPRQGGSLTVEVKSPVLLTDIRKMTFEELRYKNPKAAIEKISEDYKIYCEKVPGIDYKVEFIRRPKITEPVQRKTSYKKTSIRKPSMRPRNLMEVLLNASHLDYFKEFLKERKCETPLQFLLAVHKITSETNEILHKTLRENVIKTFFHGRVPPEELLQCSTPIISQIPHMSQVTTGSLLAAQGHVMKSLEEKWFKEYQDMFPMRLGDVEVEVQASPRKPSRTATTYLQKSQKRGWKRIVGFVKSFCKYRRIMLDNISRQEFQEYLNMELYSKENVSSSGNAPSHPGLTPSNARSSEFENGETPLLKRRMFGHKTIIINFLVNDIDFFSEMEKFNTLVSSSQVLQANRLYKENDVILLRNKLSIILKLYLQSEFPPKLRVNISEFQKDAIIAAYLDGNLDRSIFHSAILSLFPIIMHFWRRFCAWKAIRAYLRSKGKKLKEKRTPPKAVFKYPPPWSGGKLRDDSPFHTLGDKTGKDKGKAPGNSHNHRGASRTHAIY